MDSLTAVWKLARGLKLQKRRGWSEQTKIQHPESVADHSFAVALLGLVEADRRGYNVARTLKLALIHDLEETITGDLTPREKRKRGSNRVMEDKRAARRLIIQIMPRKTRTTLRKLWRDLCLNESKEARLVHDLDKLEMALQAKEYAEKTQGGNFVDFYNSADREIRDPKLRRTLKTLTG